MGRGEGVTRDKTFACGKRSANSKAITPVPVPMSKMERGHATPDGRADVADDSDEDEEEEEEEEEDNDGEDAWGCTEGGGPGSCVKGWVNAGVKTTCGSQAAACRTD